MDTRGLHIGVKQWNRNPPKPATQPDVTPVRQVTGQGIGDDGRGTQPTSEEDGDAMTRAFIAMVIPMGEGPTDPGVGIPGLPGPGGPVDPGFGRPGGPVDPGFGRPGGPVDPGYGIGSGLHPGQPLPRPPGYPGGGPITPPMYPSGQPLPPGVPPPPTKPGEPGEVWPPIVGELPAGGLALVWLVGVGYRWVQLGESAQPK